MIFGSIFSKIFLWFWLTMIAVAIATAFSASLLHEYYGKDAFQSHFSATQAAYAQAASAILEADGLSALEDWLLQLRGPGGLPGRQVVISDDGEILFGAKTAKDLQRLIVDTEFEFQKPMPIEGVFFEPIYRADGERYWFVSDMRFRRHAVGPRRFQKHGAPDLPGAFAIIGVAILVSGLVCFTLARYLTRPIRQLQTATQQIAAGEFSTRVNHGKAPRGDELGDLSRDFDVMAEKLQRLQLAQASLVRDVSHELRSPLARLQVALGLAEQRDDGRAQAELARIGQEISVLDELIQQLLSVARMEASHEPLNSSAIDIHELLSAIAKDASFEGSEQNKNVDVTANGDATIIGDRSLLRSALENIVRNALTHSPENSTVGVVSRPDKSANQVEIRVHDCGPGVPEPMLSELFKPFVRVETARDRQSGGFGVGLAIASAAVKQHAGQIHARNHPEGGLEVTVLLPMA